MSVHDLKQLVKDRDDALNARRDAESTIHYKQEQIVKILVDAGYYDMLTVNWSRLNGLIRNLP